MRALAAALLLALAACGVKGPPEPPADAVADPVAAPAAERPNAGAPSRFDRRTRGPRG